VKPGLRLATALTRALLLLDPPSFQNEVGGSLMRDVRRRAEELTGSRAGVRVGVWFVFLSVSLLANAVAAWGETLIRGGRFSWLDLKLGCRMLVR
jgi:hypothetical protein